MDFIISLPPSEGLSVILVIVDHLTKSAHFGALTTMFATSKVVELFVDIVTPWISALHSVRSRPSFSKQILAETL